MSEKHQSRKTILRLVLILPLLLLFSILSYAQDEPVADSIVLAPSFDTASSVMDKEAVFEGDTDDEEKEDSEDTSPHFIPKWTEGNPIDTIKLRNADARFLRNDDAFWYANTVFKKAKQKKTSGSNSFLQTLLGLFIVAGFIAFLVIYLSNSNVALFRKNRAIAQADTDPETDDIFAINYDKEIAKAIAAANYRLAVRLQFLKLLRALSERHIIQYTQDRTNFDYLLQVYHAPWYQHFFRLTRHYEYVWYGQFDIDNSKFEIISKDFSSFDRQLPQT